jgi:hypothetical protein
MKERVVKMPRSPQRRAKAWSMFADAVIERRLTHTGIPRVARHLTNLTFRSGRLGFRPDLDRTQPGSPISAALGAMWAARRALERQVAPDLRRPAREEARRSLD